MYNVKLFVILIFVTAEVKSSEYCKICLNHTLCKYPIPGPSYACTGYDASALLSRNNIIDILNRMNERRNFIALGLSKRFPAAANMRKINWSEDLAWSAQRWVDQCDPNVRPDKHDLCRKLEDKVVGQNIATIFGPSPRLNVKSFVDIWFMQSMDYYGEVSFYNRSQDAKTKYYTQLVWAETNSVGCGKARFHLQHKTVIERLVCNFAPSGNINGKPVYALGLAATQCSDGCGADEVLTGLCTCKKQSRKFTLVSSPVSSLLRILNLETSSVKQEIDPLKHGLKQTSTGDDASEYHRHHKSRHVFNNNSQGELFQLIHGVPMMNNFNDSRNLIQHYHQPDKGQSRVCHDHDHRNNFIPPYTSSAEENFRRFDHNTPPFSVPQANTNYRKFNQCNQCSGCSPIIMNIPPPPPPPPPPLPPPPVPYVNDRCTRGQINGCRAPSPCLSLGQYTHVPPHDNCRCISDTTYPPTISSPCYEVSCHCHCHATTSSRCCPNIARRAEVPVTKGETRLKSEVHYYDLFPNLARRSGDLAREKMENKGIVSTDRKLWLLHNAPRNKDKNQVPYKRKENPILKNNDQISLKIEVPQNMDEDLDYSYGSLNSRKRLNREQNKIIWQKNENKNENQPILTSLQYTTLKNKNSLRNIHNSISDETVTEPITVELKSYEEDNENNLVQHNKEKFPYSEELMRLRKTYTSELNFHRQKHPLLISTKNLTEKFRPGAGSKPNAETTGTTKSVESAGSTGTRSTGPTNLTTIPKKYTTNTTFQQKKYCTCRLAVFKTTASDEILLNSGGGGGSRTPPRYIEEYIRTSTCIKDFMNRKKISTVPMTTFSPAQETLQDEDYCKHRSLNVDKHNFKPPNRRQTSLENMASANHTIESKRLPKEVKSYIIEEYTRKKRNSVNDDGNMLRCDHCSLKKNYGPYTNQLMSYGDLYYLVLSKLTKLNAHEKKTNKGRKCPCNAGFLQTSKKSIKLVWIFLSITKIFN